MPAPFEEAKLQVWDKTVHFLYRSFPLVRAIAEHSPPRSAPIFEKQPFRGGEGVQN
jgi:hypothetical protein